MSVVHRNLVLQLNSAWQPIKVMSVKAALIAMNSQAVNGLAAKGLDIDYEQTGPEIWNFDKPISIRDVTFEEWCRLPIRPFDLVIHTPRLVLRCPTVIIAMNFSKMPKRLLRPTKQGIFERDNFQCQYTGRKLTKSELSIDHIQPVSKGGNNSWVNQVTCDKSLNFKKGNRTNEEAGLKLLKQPRAPLPSPISATITEAKHFSWGPFLYNK